MARIKKAAQFVMLVLVIVALNAFLGLEILGLTYRPFSWMTLCEAGETTVYPVIRGVQFTGDTVSITVQGDPGTELSLARTPSLTTPDWQPVGASVPSSDIPVVLTDTNPIAPPSFYRAEQLSIP